MPDFDSTAASFERYRAFPPGVPEAIRAGVWKAAGNQGKARVLDLGSGTGRIGRAFQVAGDWYVGVDASFEMLREFQRRQADAWLVQGDGASLPFGDRCFELVMLMQVLSGARGWRGLLQDVCRVLRPDGLVVVGQTVAPESGVDARMKNRLTAILEEMGAGREEPRKRRGDALTWLAAESARTETAIAAEWRVDRSPRLFMDRHRSGNRFSVLPVPVQEEAYRQLHAWAESTYGSLDTAFSELHRFELQIFYGLQNGETE